jgi:hypothetical protein
VTNFKNKNFAILIAAILTISIGASTILLPSANAHTPPWNIASSAFIHVAPNPIGVGQSATVGFWLNQPPPTAGGPRGDRFENMTVKVTHPDGTSETLGPFTSDDTGGTSTQYIPAVAGTYVFQMTFPGQTLTSTNVNPGTQIFTGDYFQPSQSAPFALTVQQEPVGGIPLGPLPTNYWQTPINAMNVHNWYTLAGASLLITGYSTSSGALYNFSSNFNPYTTAPKTSHIIWTKPEAFGGVLGGQYGGTTTYGNYYSTQQYEHRFEQLVINGFLYYTVFPGSSTTPVADVCVDLYTGKTVWSNDATNYGGGTAAQTALTSAGSVTPFYWGQILDYVSPNQYGGLAYVWTQGTPSGIVSTGTTWNMFDAATGKYILSVVNGTTMSMTFDGSGNLVGYFVNATAGKQQIMGPVDDNAGPTPFIDTSTGPTLNMWNSTTAIMTSYWTPTASGWQWRPPQNGIVPFANGIVWRAPLATNYSGNTLPGTLAIRNNDGKTIVTNLYAPGTSNYYQGGWGVFAGYSATTGQQLWIKNYTLTPFDGDVNTGNTVSGNGVFTISLKAAFSISGYSMTTGEKLWTRPLLGDNGAQPDAYSTVGGYCSIAANGTLYYAGMGGDIWSIDILTGNVNWYTNTTKLQGSAGTSTPYGIWPIWTFAIGEVADGVLFLSEGHEYSPPLFIGAKQLAINTTNGELLWAIDSFNVDSHPITAYGVMTNLNAYDNQIYAYSKGPSAITVSAPQTSTTTETPITITGTVYDISAGAQQEAIAKAFPYGVPAVSDASMTPWMEYVYMQQPAPNNVTGVPIALNVIDSNGNLRTIGTTVSNALGTYGFTWTPDIPGNYTVIANFAGSESYYPSSAQTYFYASSAPTVAPTLVAQTNLATTSDLMMYIVGATVAIIIAIALVGLLIIGKRP